MTVETLKVIKFNRLGKYTFKLPMEVTFTRERVDGAEHDHYIASNKYLDFIGCGCSVEEALDCLEMHIDASVYGSGRFDETEISEPSKVYIKRWEEYIDLEKMYPIVIKEF